jgi:hypothetical protein
MGRFDSSFATSADVGIDTGQFAWGDGMSGSSNGLYVLHPLHPFGMVFWTGLACVGGLWLIARSLPR